MMPNIGHIQYLVLWVGLSASLQYCDCFLSPSGQERYAVASRPRMQLAAEKITLIFSADFDLKTEMFPSNDEDELIEFFRSTDLRNHFLSGGGRAEIEVIDWTTQLVNMWEEASERLYGIESLPIKENGDTIISSISTTNFPGVQLTTTVFMGTKLLQDSDGFPYYRCILIADKRQLSGLPPAVWLFNKLTGSTPDIEYNPVSGGVDSEISLIREMNGEYVLSYVGSVKVTTEFPKGLIKILPTSKESMEQQGSMSIRKAVEKDIINCMDTVIQKFQSWRAKTAIDSVS
jgi:hypothetical protein